MTLIGRFAGTLAFAFAVLSPLAAAQMAPDPPRFFQPQPANDPLRLVERPEEVVSEAVPVRFNAEQMLKLKHGQLARLEIPGTVPRDVVFELAQSHGGGMHSWVGYLKDRGRSNRVIITTGPAGSFGVIDAPEGTYRIVPGAGQDWLVDMSQEEPYVPVFPEVDDARIPPLAAKKATSADLQEPTVRESLAGVNSVAVGKTTPSPQAVIDLMFVVTQSLADRLGPNLMTRLYFLVTRANTTYTDSEIAMTLRFVRLAVVPYSDSTDDGDALDAITPFGGGGTGVFADIEAQRQAAGADLVAFLRNGFAFGGHGIAWLGTSTPSAAFMYSVTTGCVSGCESVFIHEVGHNMGNAHDRYTDAFQRGQPPQPPYVGPAFPSGYGYAFCITGLLTCTPDIAGKFAGDCTSQPECSTNNASNFRDIMAYFQGTTRQLYRFSNPAITDCKTSSGDGINRSCGVATVAADSADAATSMNSNRLALSAIKTAVSASLLPGSLQFTQTAFSGPEGGTITFTVSRVRDDALVGGGGAVSVQYTVTGATATAGSDFVAASGTLNWPDGDFSTRTFAVPTTADGPEGVETFTATLQNAQGAAGVFIGYPSTSVGIILEAWPPGGTMPAGFVTPAGSSGAWTVATDQAFEGTSSLRSAQVFGDSSFQNFSNSDLVYTATFSAGPVAFAYRVSSYQEIGFFEFLVDGVSVLSNTGETGWKTFATNLGAGNHTLTWRFRNAMPSACNGGWSPPPQGGSACADRAWVDAISLPGATVVNPARLVNISTRGRVGTGFEELIGGFVVGGNSKTVVIRAIGPSLANFGVQGSLQNPTLRLIRIADNTVIASNDDWGTSGQVSQINAAGKAPSHPQESAIYITLPVGAYTAVMSGVGGGTGVGLVEVYEVDHPEIPLINISTRGRVGTGFEELIGGFVVDGSGSQQVVVRAIGPSLANFGVSGALTDPQLTIVRIADNAIIATNNDWQSGADAAQITGFNKAPSHNKEAAVLLTLPPGAYTAIVSGVGGGTGVGLVEVYTVP